MVSTPFLYFLYLIYLIFCLRALIYIFILYPNYFKGRGEFERSFDRNEIQKFLTETEKLPKLELQITTRGNEVNVVTNGLKQIDSIYHQLNPKIKSGLSIHILTESESDERIFLESKFSYPLSVIRIPSDFASSNNTQYKARALQYMKILRKEKLESTQTPLSETYVLYFDSETTITKDYIDFVVYYILKNPEKLIFQGPIFYPNNWFSANLFSRQMESLRPWSCYECLNSIKSRSPTHLHGSNLIIRADIENEIGWDFGMIENSPIITEDLYFGVKAYARYGHESFGWHGVSVNEQPPISTKASINQRKRWIRGSLQILSNSNSNNNEKERKISNLIKSKLYFYGLGFIPAIVLFTWLLMLFAYGLTIIGSIDSISMWFTEMKTYSMVYTFDIVPSWIVYLSFLGICLWLMSIQIGLFHNLKSQNVSGLKKLIEHFKILLVSPIATLVDTGTVFYVMISWYLGRRKISWEVTPK